MNAAGAAAAAIANAIKASGVLVKMEPSEFQKIASRADRSLVVYTYGGILTNKKHQYLLSYRGLAFFTRSESRISLPGDVELVRAAKIWTPP